MSNASLDLMLALAVFVCAAFTLATRYHTDHPFNDLLRWINARHWLHGVHRRH
ncbi:MAG: hypothetical protein QOH33_1062 [Paraburkholderia sp.]|nr:hypothetical protein [Paraburkholderia sp.]